MRSHPILLALLSMLSACAAFGPPTLNEGEPEAAVLARLGTPTGRHTLPAGGTRLEYATGPMGRHTWMVDLGANGTVRSWHQALEEPRLHEFQARAPGLSIDELLRTLGRPAERQKLGWVRGEVWSWRYPTNDCLWYQVSIGEDRIVRDAGFGIDPRCDATNKGRE
jgi:hypothetical protein